MNQISVNDTKWFNELLNGPTFALNTGVYSTFFKALNLCRQKMVSNITVKTSLSASLSAEVLFGTDTTTAYFIHPFANWSTEGFKVGDTMRVLQGANSEDVTIASIVGTTLTCNDPGFTGAPMNLVDGTEYPDLVFRNTTVPTSLIFKFGIIPNAIGGVGLTPSNPYASWLDSSVTQAYSTGALVISTPVALSGLMPDYTEVTESIECEYLSVVDAWEFTFEINHVFRAFGYNDAFLTNLINETEPSTFTSPNYRYLCEYLFGTNPTDPNEFRLYKDNLLNGSFGWIGKNYTSGDGSYYINSISYNSGSDAQIEATETTTITGSIKKSSGNWISGDRVVLIVMKLAEGTEYTDAANTLEESFLFDYLATTEGAATVDSGIIQNLDVDIDGVDATLLDFTFQTVYNATQQSQISTGDYYLIGMLVGDDSGAASTSDAKVVWMDVNQFTKNTDITGLITNNSMEIYSSEKTPNGTLFTTSANSWNNRLHQAVCHFFLTKNGASTKSSNYIKVTGMKGQVIARHKITEESFVLDNYDIPWTEFNAYVGGGNYQIINQTNYRDFKINPTAQANKSTVLSEYPGSYQTTQEFIVRWPFVFNWREWQYNPNVPAEFYNTLQSQNNFNYRTSNYNPSGTDWQIMIRLLVTVNTQGINTQYGILSTACTVRDFDVDPPTFNWTAVTELIDEYGVTVNQIRIGQDMRIKTTFSMATAGGLNMARIMAEHTIEEYNSTGDNFRLHSNVDWYYSQNMLKPLVGETAVKVTQDVANNLIIIESLIDKDLVDPTKSYNVYSHLEDTT